MPADPLPDRPILDRPVPDRPVPDRPDWDAFRRDPGYLGADHGRNERRTWIVAGVCAGAFAVQAAGGLIFRSMALVGESLHTAAHVAAMAVAAGAYGLARRRAGDPRFAFGTGKMGDLAGFANAVLLVLVAALIAFESLQRLWRPQAVDYPAALLLAGAGLAVTLVCMRLLRPADHGAEDLNISAAHLHLSADAVVGALAVAGLLAGWRLGWTWADPAAGLVGAVLVARFAADLIRRAAAVLLDMAPPGDLPARVRERLQAEGEAVVDLHVWRLGPGHHAAVAVVATQEPKSPSVYHGRLKGLSGLSHVTIEVQPAEV